MRFDVIDLKLTRAIDAVGEACHQIIESGERASQDQWASIRGQVEEIRVWCDDIEFWSAPHEEQLQAITNEVRYLTGDGSIKLVVGHLPLNVLNNT